MIIPCLADDFIVYTAHQDWPSRIYILRMNGTVYDYFEYDITRLCDVEVVNNEVYVAEAFAPRAYRVNLNNGDLDLIIDDWSLYYFYDIAFDGTFFYVDEWDLNRYFLNGTKDGVASFDETVYGSAWDGSFLWTMDDNDQIKCWDISSWPSITQIPANTFPAPDTSCRGLWFDGQYFWTAQSLDGMLGYIYRFDYSGAVIDQWLEPAFRGWGACLVDFTGIEENPSIHDMQRNGLVSVSPNPFKSSTTLKYSLSSPTQVILSIFNSFGELIHKAQEQQQPGKQSIRWNAGGQPTGVYFYRLVVGEYIFSGKLVLIR